MTPLAHLSGGYIVYRVAGSYTQNLSKKLVLGLSLIGAFAPDVDGLFGSQLNNHRYTAFHAPLFWLVFLFIAFILGKALNSLLIQKGIVIFGIESFLTYSSTG